jgi:acetamidase/formamidase
MPPWLLDQPFGVRLRLRRMLGCGGVMTRHHANLIRTIFHDPPSGNVHWRDIESLLRHVGVSL